MRVIDRGVMMPRSDPVASVGRGKPEKASAPDPLFGSSGFVGDMPLTTATTFHRTNPVCVAKVRPDPWRRGWEKGFQAGSILFSSLNSQPRRHSRGRASSGGIFADLQTLSYVIEEGAATDFALKIDGSARGDASRDAEERRRRFSRFWARDTEEFQQNWGFFGIILNEGVETDEYGYVAREPVREFAVVTKGNVKVPNIWGDVSPCDYVGFRVCKRTTQYSHLFDPDGHAVRGPTTRPLTFIQLIPTVMRGERPYHCASLTGKPNIDEGDLDWYEEVQTKEIIMPSEEDAYANRDVGRFAETGIEYVSHEMGFTILIGKVSGEEGSMGGEMAIGEACRKRSVYFSLPTLTIQVNT
jgi:hypothetical protein